MKPRFQIGQLVRWTGVALRWDANLRVGASKKAIGLIVGVWDEDHFTSYDMVDYRVMWIGKQPSIIWHPESVLDICDKAFAKQITQDEG